MGILKTITDEYFGETIRKEDEINIDGLDSFTDNNKKFHKKGYKPKDKDNLKKLLERMIEVRGDEGDFNDIDTSDIEDMSLLFYKKERFNGDITGWNVSGVKYMRFMFEKAKSFNQPIGNWDVSGVKEMQYMFSLAESFNQSIGNWDILSVKIMGWMFKNAKSFNQDLSEWNLNGKMITEIFEGCPIKDEYKPKME